MSKGSCSTCGRTPVVDAEECSVDDAVVLIPIARSSVDCHNNLGGCLLSLPVFTVVSSIIASPSRLRKLRTCPLRHHLSCLVRTRALEVRVQAIFARLFQSCSCHFVCLKTFPLFADFEESNTRRTYTYLIAHAWITCSFMSYHYTTLHCSTRTYHLSNT